MYSVYPLRTKVLLLTLSAAMLAVVSVEPAHAYAGMGPLLPAIGNGLMLMFIMGMTVAGLLVQPCKALLSSMKKRQSTNKTTA